MRVAFLHPDLGLGGAERLVVDAAMALKMEGHDVDMFTSHYDPTRAFDEVKGGRYFGVTVYGDWMPREVLGMLHILFAMLRNAWLALCVGMFHGPYDIIICDQVSVSIPVLRMVAPGARVLFYCHFPDQLLSPRKSALKSLYRLPFDVVEEITTLMADRIVVNSHFTAGVFAETFRLACGVKPAVLYPCVSIDETLTFEAPTAARPTILSINRFERKKELRVAVDALAAMRAGAPPGSVERTARLVMAGGYDPRLAENVEYHAELRGRCEELGLAAHDAEGGYEADRSEAAAAADVLFVRSFSDSDKTAMLRECSAVVYTPSGEHFGIVPLEAMAQFRPVLCVDDAGPKETVVHGDTGFREEQSAGAFAARMRELVRSRPLVERMGRAARERVTSTFTLGAMRRELGHLIVQIVERPAARVLSAALMWGVCACACAAAAAAAAGLF